MGTGAEEDFVRAEQFRSRLFVTYLCINNGID
jgi:hypothetical protein